MSILSMSDADVMNMGGVMPAPTAAEPEKAEVSSEDLEAQANAEQEAERLAAEGNNANTGDDAALLDDDADEEDETANKGAEAEEDKADQHDVDEDAEIVPEVKAEPQKPAKTEESTAALPADVNRIFESFRANGRDMKVKSVDEAIRLMQMGANYSQKNAQNKEKFGFLKVLEQNQLLDHEKLGFVVDLMNKKPEAIGKLIKDAGIDVHELDEDAIGKYEAKSYAPSEAVLNLDAVIEDIKTDTNFSRLMQETKSFDQQSQALLGQHPEALRQLTEQMSNGVYDKIMDEVNRRRVLGQINVPIMQAYNEIGQEMAQAGAFAAPAPKDPVKKLVSPGKKASQPSKADEERRRAAAPSKGASTKETEPAKIDFLKMSDEEFAKHLKS